MNTLNAVLNILKINKQEREVTYNVNIDALNKAQKIIFIQMASNDSP